MTPETKTFTWKKPWLGQGKAGLKRKVKMVTSLPPNKPAQVTPKTDKQKFEITTQTQATLGSEPQIEHIPVIQNAPKQKLKPKMFTKEVPPYLDPRKKPSQSYKKTRDFNRFRHRRKNWLWREFPIPRRNNFRILSKTGQVLSSRATRIDTGKLIKKFLPNRWM